MHLIVCHSCGVFMPACPPDENNQIQFAMCGCRRLNPITNDIEGGVSIAYVPDTDGEVAVSGAGTVVGMHDEDYKALLGEGAYNKRIIMQLVMINRSAKTIWDLDGLAAEAQSNPPPMPPLSVSNDPMVYKWKTNGQLYRVLECDPAENNVVVQGMDPGPTQSAIQAGHYPIFNVTYVGWLGQWETTHDGQCPVPTATPPRCSDAIGCEATTEHIITCPEAQHPRSETSVIAQSEIGQIEPPAPGPAPTTLLPLLPLQ